MGAVVALCGYTRVPLVSWTVAVLLVWAWSQRWPQDSEGTKRLAVTGEHDKVGRRVAARGGRREPRRARDGTGAVQQRAKPHRRGLRAQEAPTYSDFA